MNTLDDEAVLKQSLAKLDEKMEKINNKKIELFIHALRIENLPENYLEWKTILIVLPNRDVSRELRQYKYVISRIEFATNVHAETIHLYDLEEWKNAFRNKTQLQIRKLLKTSFGGEKF